MSFQIVPEYSREINPEVRRLDVLLTISAESTERVRAPLAVGLIEDISGSMEGTRIVRLKQASNKLIDALPDDATVFAVGFNNRSKLIFPPTRMDKDGRSRARAALADITAGGGTDMGSGLREAYSQFSLLPEHLPCGLMITDGEHNGGDLSSLLKELRGKFCCHFRGVDAGWRVDEGKMIADAFNGTIGLIEKPEDMSQEFLSFVSQAVSMSFANVRLRIWTPLNVQISEVQQVNPHFATLGCEKVSAQETDYYLGLFGNESRTYKLTVNFSGKPAIFCVPSILYRSGDGSSTEIVQGPKISIVWDEFQSATAYNADVEFFQKQARAAQAISEGVTQLQNPQTVEAGTRSLSEALILAQECGNQELTKRLSRVVQLDANGTARLLDTSDLALKSLHVGSGRTVSLSSLKGT